MKLLIFLFLISGAFITNYLISPKDKNDSKSSSDSKPDKKWFENQAEIIRLAQEKRRKAELEAQKVQAEQQRIQEEQQRILEEQRREKERQEYEACINKVKKDLPTLTDVLQQTICINYEDRAQLQKASWDSCVSELNRLQFTDYQKLICLSKKTAQVDFKNQQLFEQCVKSAAQNSDPSFFYYDFLSVNNKLSYVDRFFDECLNSNISEMSPSVGQPKVIGEYHYHSLQSTPEDINNKLGGLSGIAYDKKQKLFYTVSDSKRNPYLAVIKLLKNHDRFITSVVKTIELKDKDGQTLGFPDFEDISKLNDNHFIISSEFANTIATAKDKTASSYLHEFSDQGVLTQSFETPKEYDQQALDYDNKLVEAMTVDTKTQTIYFGTEAPLVTDRLANGAEFIRIYAKKLQNQNKQNALLYFKYPINTQNNTYLVSMSFIKDQSILTLERGFDSFQKQGLITVYKINLAKKDPSGFVEKTKLFSINDLKNQLAVGFRKIENFEGIAYVDDVSVYKTPFVVMVADDNFSGKQSTSFLMIELPKIQ